MPEWSARRRFFSLAGVALLALAVRFSFWSEIRGTPLDDWHTWDQSDMATYLEQARRIVGGDWLGREPYHPYHVWQTRAGSAEDWLRWYGPGAFHQAPLYSYLLALASTATPDYVNLARGLQLLLGAGTCVLVALLARELGGDAAAWVAGLVAALYGPLYYLEAQLLREGPAVFGFTLLLWLVVRHVARPVGAERRRVLLSAGVIGVVLGVFAMFYETASVLGIATLLALGVHGALRSAARGLAVLGATTCGFVVGFLPLLARNVAVGAAPFSTSSRLGLNLAYCNMSTAYAGGVVFSPPGPQLKQIMDASGGSIPGILREVWRSYGDESSVLFYNWVKRLAAVFVTQEFPDNTSFDFHRRHVALLQRSLSFAWIFAPGAAALVCLLFIRDPARVALPSSTVRVGRRDARGGEESTAPGAIGAPRRLHATLLLFIVLLIGAMSVVHPQARYRLFLVPILVPYAALGVVMVVRWLLARRVRPALVLIGVTVGLFIVQVSLSAPWARADQRPADSVFVAREWFKRGNGDLATAFYREAIAISPRTAWIRLDFADALERMRRLSEALVEYERALALQPDTPRLREKVDALRRRLLTTRPAGFQD